MGASSTEEKDNLVLWTCRSCGYDWRGKSPKVRATRPRCSRCGSWSVRVKDWLIDKERWKRARLDAFERANWQCEACGRDLNVSARVHHLSYDDYYHLDNLVCLCPHCHYLIEGKTPSYAFGVLSIIFGIIALFVGFLGGMNGVLVLAFIGIPLGAGLLLLALRLTSETRKVRRAVRKAVKSRLKVPETILIENEEVELQTDENFYCQGCGREISEQESSDFGGLCRWCRGMPLQRGFPAPPGFPKL
jgi:hypothetical protein